MTLYTDLSETPDRRRHNDVVTGTEKRVNAYVFYGVCVCLFVCFSLSFFIHDLQAEKPGVSFICSP